MGAEGRRVTRNNEMANFLVFEAVLSNLTLPIPRLSKAGMPSRSEGWGGLFKDEQYRLIRSASRAFVRWLRDFEQIFMFRPIGLTLRATPVCTFGADSPPY